MRGGRFADQRPAPAVLSQEGVFRRVALGGEWADILGESLSEFGQLRPERRPSFLLRPEIEDEERSLFLDVGEDDGIIIPLNRGDDFLAAGQHLAIEPLKTLDESRQPFGGNVDYMAFGGKPHAPVLPCHRDALFMWRLDQSARSPSVVPAGWPLSQRKKARPRGSLHSIPANPQGPTPC
jgi:hypothetical protein